MVTIEHQHQHEDESAEATMRYIESKRNWDVANQQYRRPQSEWSQANLNECKIYWRGKYLIAEHDDIIFYWEHGGGYFREAVEFMQLGQPAGWKTLDKLIAFRQAIRETEVNGKGYVDSLLIDAKMSSKLFDAFMRLARAHDLQHHGSHTF